MQQPKISSPSVLFLSLFGIGFSPFAPGTLASIVTIPILYLLLKIQLSQLIFFSVFAITTILATFLANWAQKKYSQHDPSWIVIDEMLGMLATYPFVVDTNILSLIIIFVLFRFFDILKIWPASYFDKKVKHGLGIVFDDLVSGLMSGLIYCLLVYLEGRYFHTNLF